MGLRPSEAQRARARALDGVRLHESSYKLKWMAEPWSDVARAADWLLELADREGADLVHLNNYVHAQLPFGVPVVVAHSCVLSRWQAVKGCPAPAHWNLYRNQVGAGVVAVDAVVAPTRAMLAEVERWYGAPRDGRASIYALPVYYEPFGLSVLEAARAGCALVLGDVGSLRELWHGAADFVPPDDPEALARSLRRLIDDGGARRASGRRARERASAYGVNPMATAYKRLYASLIEARGYRSTRRVSEGVFTCAS